MSFPINIRSWYAPVQPAVRPSGNPVVYRELLPDPQLRDLIYCYWELKTLQPLEEQFKYRVVADGCIDIFFELQEPQNSYAMGFCRQYTEFPLESSFHYAGVRFLPTMFPQLFRINASELSDRFESLDVVVPAFSRFIATNFHPGLQAEEIGSLLDEYFLAAQAQARFHADNRLYEALHLILNSSGTLNVETDLDTGISPRQLRRLFEFYIGDSPKIFSKVVRFQNMLKTQETGSPSIYDHYYDQAHFIREFRNFYGCTPGKAWDR